MWRSWGRPSRELALERPARNVQEDNTVTRYPASAPISGLSSSQLYDFVAGDGDGGFPPLVNVVLLPSRASIGGMVAGDVDGDGDPEVVLMIYHLVNGRPDPVLDLTAEVMDYQAGAEYGMLGMTFDPVDGRIILGFNGNDVDTRIVSYAVGDDGPPDPASAREILRIDKPGVGHNSGQLAYVGVAGVAPDIWAKGMRNPWRFSIDRATGDMWIGNVGEASWEAVYKIPAGQKGYNLGWPAYEGSHEAHFNDDVPAPANPVMPVYEYPHSVGRR